MEPNLLVIRLRAHADAEWALAHEDGGLYGDPHAGLPDASQAAGKRVAVVVPGARVLLTEVTLPTRNRTRLGQALPYAVEDQLAFAVESQHVAAGAQDEAGRVSVAVVSRQDMERWSQMLSQAGLDVHAMLPEPLALPGDSGQASVLLEDRQVVVRTENTGFTCEPEIFPAFWAALAKQPVRARVYDARTRAGALPGLGVTEVQHEPFDGSSLALLAQGVKDAPLNLLQGAFAARQRAGTSKQQWRIAAALGVFWLVLTLAYGFTDYVLLRGRSNDLEQQITRSFERALPGSRLVNARVQVEQALAAKGVGEEGLLRLLGLAAPALERQPGIRLQAMQFRDQQLLLRLEAPSIAALDALRNAMEAGSGLHVELASATATGNGVDGRLTISGPGG